MILRSGLIQNRPGVNAGHFAAHWREKHGPLALKVPRLKSYAQNLVTRHVVKGPVGLHAVDGISQLWFDDLPAMAEGANSPEQDACIKDIAGFLAGVTLAIQTPGIWALGADRRGFKTMFIFAGNQPLSEAEALLEEVVGNAQELIDFRLNPITVRDVIVDKTVASSPAPLLAIGEAWFSTDVARDDAIDDIVGLGDMIVATAVTETVLLQLG